MVVVLVVLALLNGVEAGIILAEEVVFVLYGVKDESSQILRQEICNDSIL
jgi:hypothetical protein